MIDKFEHDGWVCNCKVCEHEEPCNCPDGYILPSYIDICYDCGSKKVGYEIVRF